MINIVIIIFVGLVLCTIYSGYKAFKSGKEVKRLTNLIESYEND